MELKRKSLQIGKVLSDRMDKTIVVEIEITYEHPKFKKILRRTKKYKVHDELETAKIGDLVEFYQGRPISKTKCMVLSKILKSA